MTNISYMLQPEDRPRVRFLLGILMPCMREREALRVLARCSSWSEDLLLKAWPEGMTISARRQNERAWRQEFPEASNLVPGLTLGADEHAPALVDLLIAGLSLLDQAQHRSAPLALSGIRAAAIQLRREASPSRALVSSSIGREGVLALCGREKAFVMSPRNQRDLLAAIGVQPLQDLPWIVLRGSLGQATCRALWRACQSGASLSEAASMKIHMSSEAQEVPALLEGRTPVFFASEDYRDLTGAPHIYVDTVLLRRLVPPVPVPGDGAGDPRGIAAALFRLGRGCRDFGTSTNDLIEAFLRLVIEAVRIESAWHPPGGLAHAVLSGDALPNLCGPELTS